MKNQSSNSSVDKEIQSQSSKPSQHSLVQSQLPKDQQEIRIKSNSSSHTGAIKKLSQINIKNHKVKRPSSVTQRPTSIPKFTSSHSNEAPKIVSNSNNRSQDDSYAVNSHISSVNSSCYIVPNSLEQSSKPINVSKQIAYNQRSCSIQAISQANNCNNVLGGVILKGGSSTSLQAVQQGVNVQTLSSNAIFQNSKIARVGEDRQKTNQNSNSELPCLNTTQTVQIGGNLASSNSEVNNMKHASSVDFPFTVSQNTSDKQLLQQSNRIQNLINQQIQQASKKIKLKQKEINASEEEQDQEQRDQDDSDQQEQNEYLVQEQNQITVGSNGVKMNKVNINSQAFNSNNGLGVNNESEKFELSNGSSSKLTSKSETSRSQKNQLSASSDSLQDSKQESVNSNSGLVSSSNNSSKIFKGSSNSSFIVISTKIQSGNSEKGNLNEYIQSKEEINKSIFLRHTKPRESHISQNSRIPIKLIQQEETKVQIISQEDAKGIPGILSEQKPNTEVNETQISVKHTKNQNGRQLIHRRGNTLSRSEIDEFQLLDYQDNNYQSQQSEDLKQNSLNPSQNKVVPEQLRNSLSVNPLQFVSSIQTQDFKIRSNEDDIQNDQDDEQKDYEEEANDIDIKKQLENLNSDDEDKMSISNGNSNNNQVYQQQNMIYQPIPVSQQQQQQVQYPSHIYPFIEMQQNSSTPQLSIYQQQQQQFDPFINPLTSSTPNQQQIENINSNRVINGRPLSIGDQQFSQFYMLQKQQQVINIPENCGSPSFLNDFSVQQQQQQQQPQYVMYEPTAHQHRQAFFNQTNQQLSPNMNLIQFNQLHSSTPPSASQQQQGFQMIQQNPQLQQIMCQLQPQALQQNVQIQQSQHSQLQAQSQQQQGQIYSNSNSTNLGQQGQQMFPGIGKGLKQPLQIQSQSLFSSNSNSTYHLQKQNCNLSQASTTESELINTYRSVSSYGISDKQQDIRRQQIQNEQASQNQQVNQLSFISQNQSQQSQQQQQQQQINSLNFIHHHPQSVQQVQQENQFFSQLNPSNQLLIQDNYQTSNPYNYPSIDPQQFQQNQQLAFAQNNYMHQLQQSYISQNHPSMNTLNISQMSPDKFSQGPHTFSNPTLLNNAEANQSHKTQFGQQFNHYRPTHSKQLSCQQFGQFDSQNQFSIQSQNVQQQRQYSNMSFHQNNFNSSMNQGSFISNNSESNQINSTCNSNSSQINIPFLSTSQSKGKKKQEIKEVTEKYDIDLDKLEEDQRTSVCIKNIPNKYEKKLLLHTFKKYHKYIDFFYLPIDFKNKCNVGYAFINFLKPEYIREFFIEFNGKKWEKFNSEKICNLKYASVQGFQQLKQHFEKSSVMHKEEKFKPEFFNVISEIIEHQKQMEYNTSGQSQNYEGTFNNNNSNNNGIMNLNSNMNISKPSNNKQFPVNSNSYSNNNIISSNNNHINDDYINNDNQNYSNNNRYSNNNNNHSSRQRNTNIKYQQKPEQYVLKQ